MTTHKIRRRRAAKEIKQMPLDMWIPFTALALGSKLTRSQLSAFLREARKRGFVKHKFEDYRIGPQWKRIGLIVNF